MEYARKMILVPSDVMERLPNKQDSHHISRIDEEMKNILHTANIPDNDKWDMYREVLLKYLNHLEKQKKPACLPVIDVPATSDLDKTADSRILMEGEESKTVHTDEILNSVPQTFRRKACLLHDRILRSVRPRKNTTPYGWEIFCSALHEMNIPQEYIGNQKRWNFIRGLGSVEKESKPS
ncbi:hypothetical protein J437_LFUL005554 [Ladona fulva]|uniref:Uncharacterized protein n=1 Tax=Ladona fulva TaxID=123851 RepID=A0A8K0K6R6_LADFU|nr:hypothetical protein J437_LFUL005554 [Ladona fulva]